MKSLESLFAKQVFVLPDGSFNVRMKFQKTDLKVDHENYFNFYFLLYIFSLSLSFSLTVTHHLVFGLGIIKSNHVVSRESYCFVF